MVKKLPDSWWHCVNIILKVGSYRNVLLKTCQIPVVNMPYTLNMTKLCFTTWGVQTWAGAAEVGFSHKYLPSLIVTGMWLRLN